MVAEILEPPSNGSVVMVRVISATIGPAVMPLALEDAMQISRRLFRIGCWILTAVVVLLSSEAYCQQNQSNGAAAPASEEVPTDIIAAQIRRQGFVCDHPQTATRDANQSKPDEAAWLLTCESSSYRVTLIPHEAAKVQQVQPQK